MWFWLACTSNEMKAASDESTFEMDTGFYTDTGLMGNEAEEDASPEILPSWKKISVNIESELEEMTAYVWEDLYAADMNWLCQRQIEYGKVETLESPVEQISSWFQLSQPTLLETSCGNDDGIRAQIQVGVGDLVQDIAVATEVTHWLEQDVSLETEAVWGAYIEGSSDHIWTFGVAYQPDEGTVVLRTVYSLPF